jgi:hypothetical protein
MANLMNYTLSQSGTSSSNICNGQLSPYYNASRCGGGWKSGVMGMHGRVVIEVSAIPASAPSSGEPSSDPSGQPSVEPSHEPSGAPSGDPSSQPSGEPSVNPSGEPSGQPSEKPSGRPSYV